MDYCSHCGADVKLYRKMMQLSNAYYNDGLEKAQVRDLTGAVQSLEKSLKIHKRNIDARNLLGLVYFEMGEVVEALTQWIISQNFQRKKNLANDYIKAIQDSPGKLETINTTIKKYNQSLQYCEQGSYDLAIIQLKKILSTNNNLLKGHLLLALLYMKNENYGRARTELKRILAIDHNYTPALRYLQKIDAVTKKDDSREKEEKNQDAISYTSGNETIIQPVGVNDNSGLHTVVNIFVGLVLGVAVMWFLLFPAQQKKANSDLNKAIAEYSEQVESKTAALESLQQEVSGYKTQAEEATANAKEIVAQMSGYESLVKAYYLQKENDAIGAMELLDGIDQEALTEEGKALYEEIHQTVAAKAVGELYRTGYAAYESGDFATAIADLGKCYALDHTQGDALYFLARSYHRSGDKENAKIYYQKVIDEQPNTKKATDAASFLAGL